MPALAQYYACDSDYIVKIPDAISWEEAGCIQPLAVAVQVNLSLTPPGIFLIHCSSWRNVPTLQQVKPLQSCTFSLAQLN